MTRRKSNGRPSQAADDLSAALQRALTIARAAGVPVPERETVAELGHFADLLRDEGPCPNCGVGKPDQSTAEDCPVCEGQPLHTLDPGERTHLEAIEATG